MFGLGIPEILFILLLAILILGPEHMPRAARTLGKWSAKARSAASSLTEAVTQDEDFREISGDISDIRKELGKIGNDVKTVKSGLEDPISAARTAILDARSELDSLPDTIAGRHDETHIENGFINPDAEPLPDTEPVPSPFFSRKLKDIGTSDAQNSESPAPVKCRAAALSAPRLLPGEISRLVSRRRVQLAPPGKTSVFHAAALEMPRPGRALCIRRRLPELKHVRPMRRIRLAPPRKGNTDER